MGVPAALLFLFFLAVSEIAASSCPFVSLPVEVAGDAGSSVSVVVSVPPGLGKQARSLRMQIHGMAYAGMVSVRINHGHWWLLSNETVKVAEPGRSYGGIGGALATLKITLPIPEGSVVDDSNTIQYRFNGTDGVVSGFRVLAFDFLTADGRGILPTGTFVEEDPNSWAPPMGDRESVEAGRMLWERAPLTAGGLPNAPLIHAHCSDCHAQDGRDLKYFNFSNLSIVARSRFHGLSELQGRQIASYIRSLPIPNPGRPWNPPYQPGPGLDAQPIANWSAGAGLAWVLEDDVETLPFLFGGKGQGGKLVISPAAFRPDSDLTPREIPIAFQLPDWNHWLPRVHPLDFRELNFKGSSFFQLYQNADYAGLIAADSIPAFFDKWTKARSMFLTPHLPPESGKWTPKLADSYYSAQLWQLVKTWEITQRFGLESTAAVPRLWLNTIPAGTAPAEVGIPDTSAGMNRSALTNEYFNNAWYEVQMLVNSGNHRHHGRLPIDWVYFAGHYLDLQELSKRPEPARLLIAIIKAMQSTDPLIGPDNYAEGWRPERNIDPRILVSREWEPVFQKLPENVRQAITESLLSAWLDKTLQFRPASYFVLGPQQAGYKVPTRFGKISGDGVWEAAQQFKSAGVSPAVIERLETWRKAYLTLAELFHY